MASATSSVPASGDSATFAARFTSGAGEVGDPLTIQLKSTGAQGNFDSVMLTASPVPKPGTLLLFGSGLLLLGMAIVRRKQLYARELSA